MLYRFSYSSIDFVFVDLCGASYLDLIMSVAGLDCFVLPMLLSLGFLM